MNKSSIDDLDKVINGPFIKLDEKNRNPGRLYPKPPEKEKSIYHIFKMPANENDRRHKEKQIAKRRHDKRMKKLQRQKKK